MAHLRQTANSTWHRVSRAAKAVAAGPAAGATYLLGVWSEDTHSFAEAFGGMTPNQWLLFGLSVLGGWGVTYTVKNRKV